MVCVCVCVCAERERELLDPHTCCMGIGVGNYYGLVEVTFTAHGPISHLVAPLGKPCSEYITKGFQGLLPDVC